MPPAERSMVPRATPTSYYGRPVIKEPTWRWMIPAYLFTGGLAAGTAMTAAGARFLGDDELAARANLTSLGAVAASGALLVADLGRPERFHHMLRVAKPTSPMSVGTWIFSAFSALDGAAGAARVAGLVGIGPSRALGRVAGVAGLATAATAPALATYTGVLLADTAVPAWHEARGHLPWLFAASATAAGAAATVVLDATFSEPGPAAGSLRALTVLAAGAELAVDRAMHHHLDGISTGDPAAPDLGFPYRDGTVRTLARGARLATGLGAAAVALGRRRRGLRAAGGLAVVVGSALERFAVFHAGKASARHPAYTVGPQRAERDRQVGAER